MNSIDSGIYSITSKINGKRYIGSAIRLNNKNTYFGNYLTEAEAVKRVKEVKLELDIE